MSQRRKRVIKIFPLLVVNNTQPHISEYRTDQTALRVVLKLKTEQWKLVPFAPSTVSELGGQGGDLPSTCYYK